MASGLGPGFVGFRRSFFPNGWNVKFWFVHHIWFAATKNVERRRRTVLSVLADKFWALGPSGIGAGRLLYLAYLERRLALGKQTSRGYRLCIARACYLRHWLLLQNCAVGLGQSQAHGLGLLYYSSVPLERHHRALGVSRASSDVHRVVWFGICYVARWTHGWPSRFRTDGASEAGWNRLSAS